MLLAGCTLDVLDDLLARAFLCLSHRPLLSGYDEPETLTYQILLFGPIGADVKQWAPVAEAARWIAERYPEQLPAKYGCSSWRQVVHKTPILELRYLEVDGQRTACYLSPRPIARHQPVGV
ncbi:MAG: hypothetical protein GY924_19570 [Planctomycetaceae bacterium]|nr:hypothetical protein [Planctomycetaceae bacterium]